MRMSSQVRMPLARISAQTLTSFEMLPIQLSAVALNCVPSVRPSSGSNTMPRANVAITVPSFGAAL